MVSENSLPEVPKQRTVVREQDGLLETRETSSTPVTAPWSVEGALAKFDLPTRAAPPKSPIQFFHFIERLKTTPREGWRRFDIQDGESISDHMYRMSILTMLAPEPLSVRLDVARCTRMALIHDMAEALVGDITPVDGISKREKSRRESETIAYVADHLLGSVGAGGREAGRMIRRVWQEYEDGETMEARFVHDVDKVELLLQMVEYEKAKQHRHLDLGEFTRVVRKVQLSEMQGWCAEVLKEREEFWRTAGKTDVQGLGMRKEIGSEAAAAGAK